MSEHARLHIRNLPFDAPLELLQFLLQLLHQSLKASGWGCSTGAISASSFPGHSVRPHLLGDFGRRG
jgi:hypothetical protein